MISNTAFVLAAGFGTRLRPHTSERPKPLVTVNNISLLDRTLIHLKNNKINKIAVNSHYLHDALNIHLSNIKSPHIEHLHEPEILDTGGGIKNGLALFSDAPFFVLSGDGLWDNRENEDALMRMRDIWDADTMDILILLQPVEKMVHTKGVGDYNILSDGRAVRSLDQTGTHMFTSIRINHPRIFNGTPNGAFSYLPLLDNAQAKGRLHAIEHTGNWHHISTPEDLSNVRALYETTEGQSE